MPKHTIRRQRHVGEHSTPGQNNHDNGRGVGEQTDDTGDDSADVAGTCEADTQLQVLIKPRHVLHLDAAP